MNNDTFSPGTDPSTARRRILAQGVNILHALVEEYNRGNLDDPSMSANLCTMFALVAEGKVVGHFDQDLGITRWSLTDNYLSRLREAEEQILASKIVKGPWTNSVDTDLNT